MVKVNRFQQRFPPFHSVTHDSSKTVEFTRFMSILNNLSSSKDKFQFIEDNTDSIPDEFSWVELNEILGTFSYDSDQLKYNDYLTLDGIPSRAFDYRLGNRSALEWVIDQYRVRTDKRSGIVNDPNRDDDPQYIIRLIRKIISVSLETVSIVDGLPALGV